MSYTATEAFFDSKDNGRYYEKGDCYPREGLEVSKPRFEELTSLGVIVANGKEVVSENPKDFSELTLKELKAELDKKGVKYPGRAKKEDLLKLL